MDRERFKGNNRDAFIDSHDYEMLLQDNDEVSTHVHQTRNLVQWMCEIQMSKIWKYLITFEWKFGFQQYARLLKHKKIKLHKWFRFFVQIADKLYF